MINKWVGIFRIIEIYKILDSFYNSVLFNALFGIFFFKKLNFHRTCSFYNCVDRINIRLKIILNQYYSYICIHAVCICGYYETCMCLLRSYCINLFIIPVNKLLRLLMLQDLLVRC